MVEGINARKLLHGEEVARRQTTERILDVAVVDELEFGVGAEPLSAARQRCSFENRHRYSKQSQKRGGHGHWVNVGQITPVSEARANVGD